MKGKRKRKIRGKEDIISNIRANINFLFKLESIISQNFGRHNGSKSQIEAHNHFLQPC
jgi:hypothetical protein